MVKLPAMFESIFVKDQPLSEEIGEALARWSTGGEKPAAEPAQKPGSRPAEKTSAPTAQPAKTAFETSLDCLLEGTGLDSKTMALKVLDWAVARQLIPGPERTSKGEPKGSSVRTLLDRLWAEREEQVAGKIEELITLESIPTD